MLTSAQSLPNEAITLADEAPACRRRAASQLDGLTPVHMTLPGYGRVADRLIPLKLAVQTTALAVER